MKYSFLTLITAGVILFASCQSKSQTENSAAKDSTAQNSEAAASTGTPVDVSKIKVADAKTILARKQVPILCYHQVRNWKPTDGKVGKDYIVEIQNFKDQMKMLADSGYHTILPDQLYAYLNTGAALPSKPIMLTFDDTDLDQFTIVRPTLDKLGYKAVYFIMTVSIGKKGKFVDYMSKEQIKQLADEGNVIGSHTYDHKNFKKYAGKDWEEQLDKPTKKLEEITGKKMTEFAYPFGLWNAEGIPELKKRGFRMAYQLSTKRDEKDPLFTIRRIIASGYWSPKTLSNSIKNSF
ncbi:MULTISPECIES: polysaccharide deacetylase family protein [unclassified Pedobacter]|uniref:polysaccharide deacetylase family protein n=1 Tax=unclassified Pedobacter TaxID=2628915 RepID=UPI001DAD24EE|nr:MULTISPECIES: polysaccharide deacetylase family protein [unclassified Pedobacter]CAH0270971.1 Poly-beta-1,6-N-acetyl-D-glucosamine N-deacetylase [Pedobacter sp. Bi36]CAH0300128.1 Poly-beta-1,6-N-acetyl-D-glucosamine N-deacetylase [Pedobacter sp. Bi126]